MNLFIFIIFYNIIKLKLRIIKLKIFISVNELDFVKKIK